MTTLTKAGRYELHEELGRGAMGVVYRGHDPVIGRDVAVKTMRLSEAGTGMSREELINRFQTEARAAGLLAHPNIVVIYDAGEEGGLFYITMEFVEGRSLQSLVDSRQPFSLPRVMKLMEQVCSALDFAHQHNVVHRDIKPANLMLTADDTVKITDFGTAKILQFGTAQTANVMGTPSYMSPEQVKGKPVDGRSDIFSLGVILYELMTGEKPFPGQNITTVIYKIINEDPIPPRMLDSSIHPGLSAVITKALAKDPAERFQSCHELLNALKNYHEMVNPETTLRIPPQASQPTAPGIPPDDSPWGSGNGSAALPAKESAAPPRLLTPPRVLEEEPRNLGSLPLTFILLAIIGFAGYRVYPPLMDLWQRARVPVESRLIPAKKAPSQAAKPESSNPKPQTESDSPSQTASPAPQGDAAPQDNLDSQDSPQPAAPPAIPVKASGPAPVPVGGAEKPVAPQKPAPTPTVSPARLFESKLHAEIASLPLASKVKIQTTGNALTLSGSLAPAEHRELLEHLRAVPTGVRVIDDVEYSEAPKAAAEPASAGWVWVRSSPPGASIAVDGTETGQRTPARLELREGEHQVSLVLPGFATANRTLLVHSGLTMQITTSLTTE